MFMCTTLCLAEGSQNCTACLRVSGNTDIVQKLKWYITATCVMGHTRADAGGGQLEARDGLARQLQQREPDNAAEQATLRVLRQLALQARLGPVAFKSQDAAARELLQAPAG